MEMLYKAGEYYTLTFPLLEFKLHLSCEYIWKDVWSNVYQRMAMGLSLGILRAFFNFTFMYLFLKYMYLFWKKVIFIFKM